MAYNCREIWTTRNQLTALVCQDFNTVPSFMSTPLLPLVENSKSHFLNSGCMFQPSEFKFMSYTIVPHHNKFSFWETKKNAWWFHVSLNLSFLFKQLRHKYKIVWNISFINLCGNLYVRVICNFCRMHWGKQINYVLCRNYDFFIISFHAFLRTQHPLWP